VPKYTYISRDQEGQRITAMMEAVSRQELLTRLKDRGLTVLEVKELGERGMKEDAGKKTLKSTLNRPLSLGRIGTGDLAIFWREFATMIAAGLPIVDALQSIAEEMDHPKFQQVLRAVVSNIWEGFNFSESLKRHPQIFSPMVVALIGAAEESGSLPEVTNQLATFLENRDRIIRKVWAALTYPICLSVAFLGALLFGTFWIIPRFRDIYSEFDAPLPWLTQQVFALNAFVLHYFPWIAAAAILVLVAFILWLVLEQTRIGAMIRATVDDAEMARGVGINVPVISMGVFALGAFLAAAGGVVAGGFVGVYPGADFEILPYAFVVVIVGGMGSLKGALIGSLMVGLLDNFGKAFFPELSYFTLFAPMAAILAVRPTGLFGRT